MSDTPKADLAALREAATTLIAAEAAFSASDSACYAADAARTTYSAAVRAPHTILALLSLAERGAEDTKLVAEMREALRLCGITRSDEDGDEGATACAACGHPRCIHLSGGRCCTETRLGSGLSCMCEKFAAPTPQAEEGEATHELKVWSMYADAIDSGVKTYMRTGGAKFGWPCSLDPAHPGGHEHAADYWPRDDKDTCAPDPAEPTEAEPC